MASSSLVKLVYHIVGANSNTTSKRNPLQPQRHGAKTLKRGKPGVGKSSNLGSMVRLAPYQSSPYTNVADLWPKEVELGSVRFSYSSCIEWFEPFEFLLRMIPLATRLPVLLHISREAQFQFRLPLVQNGSSAFRLCFRLPEKSVKI